MMRQTLRDLIPTIVLAAMFAAPLAAQPPEIGPPVLQATELCWEKTFTVTFSTTGTFASNNTFRLELSGPDGSFEAPNEIGRAPGSTASQITGTVPRGAVGTGFRLRIVASSPAITGPDNGRDLAIQLPPGLPLQVSWPGTDTAVDRAFDDTLFITVCDPRLVSLNGHAEGRSGYYWSNGAAGQQLIPPHFGTYALFTYGPDSLCRAESQRITILPADPIEADIMHEGEGPVCEGDEVVLAAAPLGDYRYQWSTGDTTPTLTVTESGFYSLYVFSRQGCVDTAGPLRVDFGERPVEPVITRDGGKLISTIAYAYQWTYDGYDIDGATEREYVPEIEGTYGVRVMNLFGCGTPSRPYVFTMSDVAEGTPSTEALRVYPLPASDRLVIELPDERGANILVALTDLDGREILRQAFASARASSIELSVRDVPVGAYALRVVGERFDLTAKIVVAR